MIRDDQFDSQLLRTQCGLDRGHTAIDRDEDVHSFRGEFLDRGGIEPVALIDPVGHVDSGRMQRVDHGQDVIENR